MHDTSGTASSLPVQVEIPGYRLRRQIGSDSIGLWFDAEQESLGRKVTLKILRPKYEQHDPARREFLAEMDRLGDLDHTNLPRVLDTQRAGLLVLVVERIGITTAETTLRPGKPMPDQTALQTVLGVGRALRYLTAKDLAHKNVTPRFIALRDDGACRLVTLRNVITLEELAKLKGRLAQDPQYIAPEQLVGEATPGPAAHVYHLGGLLYHLLAGRPPFNAGEPKKIAMTHVADGFPSLKRVQPFMKAGLLNLVAACTQGDPDPRPSLDEVVAACEALLAGNDHDLKPEPPKPQTGKSGIVAPKARRKRRRR